MGMELLRYFFKSATEKAIPMNFWTCSLLVETIFFLLSPLTKKKLLIEV